MKKAENLTKHECKAVGLSGQEKKLARTKFREYQTNYHIENFSDIQLLEELVYRETIQERYKKKVEDLNTKVKKQIIPKFVQSALDDNLNQILILKDKLGLFEDKKETKDAFKHIQILKKKFKAWREENQGSRTCICPHC